MNYIDSVKYKELLGNFAKGTPKGLLQENYIDMRPLNSLSEDKPTKMDHINNTYPGAKEMEEATGIKNPGKYKPKAYDLDGDGVPNGADKAPEDGAKHEGLKNLSQDELTELRAYVESMKTTKRAIQELLNKAKGMQSESGNNTDLTLDDPSDTTSMSGEEEEDSY